MKLVQRRIAIRLAAAVALLTCAPAGALINPNFTPVHLVRQSAVILELEFSGKVSGGKAAAAVRRALKGKAPARTLTIDLTASAYPERAKLVGKRMAASGKRAVLMFIGSWPDKPGEAPAADEAQGPPAGGRKAFLHMEGMWLVLYEDAKGTWGFDEISQPMIATWHGGTDMLRRAVRYILRDSGAEVPSKTGSVWGGIAKFADAGGKVSAAWPVDLKGDGKLAVFVASDAGDRLFAFAGGKLADVTAGRKLRSRSLAAAWGDFNADGRADLASWDGKTIALHLQGPDGTFAAGAGTKLAQCIGLAAAGGAGGKAALVVSTVAAPLVWVPGGGEAGPLAGGEWPGKALGRAGACLVADFDGDALPDVLQPLAQGGLLYKGLGPGRFAAPTACAVALGKGRAGACLGDWDADGLLDVFTAAADGCRIWQNAGGGRFVESLRLSGEIAYVSKPGGLGGQTGDVNNDGRQDLLVVYPNRAPQVFFNRGFRSFGFSLSLDLASGGRLPGAAKGLQAGCLADLTGDGAQDLVIVLNDGACHLLAQAATDAGLCARAVLGRGAGPAGPVTVRGSHAGRPLGAWNVGAGGPGAFFGCAESGVVDIRWRLPGGKARARKVLVEDEPVTVVLEPARPAK